MCNEYVPMHLQRPEKISIMLCLIPLKQGLSLKLELGWDLANSNTFFFAIHRSGITGMWPSLDFYIGAEDLNSGPVKYV